MQYHDETSDLKRKLADTEKRFILLWEHVKESNRKTELKFEDIQI